MSPPLVNHGVSIKIPTPSSSAHYGEDTPSHDPVLQAEDNDVFGSRASSVTVMSDPDRASLFSPFATPISHGVDMPIVRTHPFGIRTTPLSLVSPGEVRKGSQNEVESSDVLHTLHTQMHLHVAGVDTVCAATSCSDSQQQQQQQHLNAASARLVNSLSHSSDLSTSCSSSSCSLLKKTPNPTPPSSSNDESTVANTSSCDPPLSSSPSSFDFSSEMDEDPSASKFRQRKATCPEISTCSLRKDILTFDPNNKQLLSTDHTRVAPPSLTLNSSLDSGYDQSLSLTNSSRDSCPEFAGSYSHGVMFSVRTGASSNKNGMVCSNKNGMVHPRKNGMVCYNKSGLEDASCRDGQAVGQEGACQPAALLPELPPQLQKQEAVRTATLNGMAAEKQLQLDSKLGYSNVRDILNISSHDSLRRHISSDVFSSSNSSPARMESTSTEEDEVSSPLSPLSPDPTNHMLDLDEDVSMTMVEGLSISQDPLISLPPRKLKNHIQAVYRDRERNPAGEDDGDVCANTRLTTDQDLQVKSLQCWNHAASNLGTEVRPVEPSHKSLPSPVLSYLSPSVNLTGVAATSSLSFSKMEHNQSNVHDSHISGSNLLIESSSISLPPLQAPDSSSPPCNVPLIKAHQPSSDLDLESPCSSEADSGRGTKTSIKTGELESSLTSELSNDPDSDCTPILSSLRLNYFEGGRASSSPPVFGRFRSELEEEMCSSGRGESQSFPSSCSTKVTSGRKNDLTRSSSSYLCMTRKPSADCNLLNQSPDNHQRSSVMTEDESEQSLKKFSPDVSLLHPSIHGKDDSELKGDSPSTLEKFDDFVKIPLPNLDEFHMDSYAQYCVGVQEESESHRQKMSDFGHSLFAG